jgi:hypothetical protein
VLAVALFGCSATLGDDPIGATVVDAGDNGGGGGGSGSGSGSGNGSGSGSGMQPDAGTASACANGRKLYLNFDGVTLTRATPSDSTQNKVSWMSNATATVPPWHQGSGTRANDIATIVAGVKSRLSTLPIEVVTQRPASGPYVMVVFGGDRTIVGTTYSFATNEHDCGDLVKNDVGWISDEPNVSYTQDLVIGTVGWGVGLNGTNEPTDCMCAWANNCESASGACTLSASIASTNSSSPATTCPNQNPQNEIAAFSTGFCQ